MRTLLALWVILLLNGCQSDPLSGKNDPKSPWWSLTFTEPRYMKVWVEDSAVEDINGKLFLRTGGGTAAGGEPEDGTESARGWHRVSASLKGVSGAGLPKRIYVRWQSIAEQKTYRGWIDIPEEARQIMRASTEWRCAETPEQTARFIAAVSIGLAPGGVMQVWVRDSCSRPIVVARAQAEIEPLGPHLGKSGGKYYPQSENSKRYIEQYGIPFGSW
jgi:hypothetical protein